jgi:hypothetical protein
MADSLADILAKDRFNEPPEVKVIKDYLHTHFQADCVVTVNPRQIIVGVKGASLAGALRVRLHELQALCQTQKRLVIRIN